MSTRRAFLVGAILPACSSWSVARAGEQQQPDTSVDMAVSTQMSIRRPESAVWAKLIKIEDWITDLEFQRVDGVDGEMGSLLLARPRRAKGPFMSSYIQIIRADAARRLVLRVTPESGEAYLGFGIFRLERRGNHTLVTYDLVMDLKVSRDNIASARAQLAAQEGDTAKQANLNFATLNKLLSNGI